MTATRWQATPTPAAGRTGRGLKPTPRPPGDGMYFM
uniref:Uncharacterized protein n=1 Tax=Caudovirales sp. ct2A51 TaxID=2827630 RepID=A0A8S5SZR4_9CAUD|nr:MAG TPA: hypothetical protein [Caudovirales sp. ct2A51]